jgi:pimeloyl-ACP methyl ester carboxylesterase
MADERMHRAVSADGTEIAGRVSGDGPPLVLVHSVPHDGDLAWEAMLPHLTDRFTTGPLSTDPEMLAQVAAPVLVLRGQETPPWLGTVLESSEQHVAELHVSEPMPGLGHYAPLLAPERIARKLISFFESVR